MLHRFFWSSLAFGDATTVFLGSTYPKCTVQIVEARFVALQVNVDAFFHALGSRQKSGVFRSILPTMWEKSKGYAKGLAVRTFTLACWLVRGCLGTWGRWELGQMEHGAVSPGNG